MLLQANISGFAGRNATVIGAIDLESHSLLIKRADIMIEQRFQNAGLITNQPLTDFDYFFTEQDFKQAFLDYRFYHNSGRLIIDIQAQRATPPLQVEKISENGANYVIYGDITNEQIGVIALCFFARKVTDYEQSINAYALADDNLLESWITI